MALYKTTAFYTPELLRKHRTKAFLFGDNLRCVGKGGQAAIRDERNALGIPTKATPSMDPAAFFYDDQIHLFIQKVVVSLEYVRGVASGTDIVVPFTSDGKISLGLGLAELDKNSPVTYRLICTYLEGLADHHGGWKTLEG
jgi:hypothetical protein